MALLIFLKASRRELRETGEPGRRGRFFRERGSLESRKIPPNFNPSKSRVENRGRMGGGRVGRENFRRHKRDDGAVVVLFLQGHSPGGRARVNRSLDLVEA